MARARENACAFASVIQRVFPEDFREAVACCRGNRSNAKVGSESLAETFCSLFPLGQRIVELVDPGRGCRFHNGNGAKRDKAVAPYSLSRRWASICRNVA